MPTWPASQRGGWKSSCSSWASSGCRRVRSRASKSLDAIVEDFRTRPLAGARYPCLVLDALNDFASCRVIFVGCGFAPGGGAVWFCDRVLTLGGPEVMLTFCDALAVLLAGAAFSADA